MSLDEVLPTFIQRCDAYANRAGISRVTVSKKLFGQTRKLDQLAKGEVDVGVARLREADQVLKTLEREADSDLPPAADPPPDPVQA